jgi:hypothetical protein
MLVASNFNSNKSRKEERNSLNLVLIAEVEIGSTVMDVDEIIAGKNITNLCTLEILYSMVLSKNIKMDSFAPNI